MLTEYFANVKKQITKHFNSSEFLCKCGKGHSIKLNDELCTRLEDLYSYLNCSKIIISSGVRCASWSVKVGGYATDEHVKGNAADIVCYDNAGKIINSKLVCCAAQDLDFAGIGRISDTATHIDISPSRKWRGDELCGYTSKSIPGNDFYSYFGLKKPKRTKYVELCIDDHKYSGLLEEV